MIRVTQAELNSLQSTLDLCAPETIVQCECSEIAELAKTLVVRKPLTLRGLRARLPAGKGDMPLVLVAANGVTFSDFELVGNRSTVSQAQRQSLLVVQGNDFHVANGVFRDSTRNGLSVELSESAPKNSRLVGGTIENVDGYDCARDVVSVSGNSNDDERARWDCAIMHVLIDNVRCFKDLKALHPSEKRSKNDEKEEEKRRDEKGEKNGNDPRVDSRGALEVSDGTANITVKRVYAENSEYALDLQTHESKQKNKNIVVDGPIVARNCLRVVGTRTMPGTCSNVEIRNVTAQHCQCAVEIRQNIDGLRIENVVAVDQDVSTAFSTVFIAKCNQVDVKNVRLGRCNIARDRAAVEICDCSNVSVDAFAADPASKFYAAVRYEVNGKNDCKNVRLSGVDARSAYTAGIVLDRAGKGSLESYTVAGNNCAVLDRIKGKGANVSV